MSFSFSASGTREQVMASLATQAGSSTVDGQAVHQLLTRFLHDAPETANEGLDWIYEVSVSGHHGGGTPSLSVRVTARIGSAQGT
jgi:hypothetical protein